jgi:deoxyadenosine/deoxycytidine kinase
MSDPRFIVVEGPIGVGKTTLAHRLAETFGSELLLEGAEENPFLERFYRNPRDAALPTQMFFLFQRARQMQELRQGDMFEPVRVADFMLEKDRLFAELTLDSDELQLYEKTYNLVTMDAPQPDLVIYLQAPVEVLMQRIARRARRGEENIATDYLKRVTDTYSRFFYEYTGAPLLIVNAAEIDLASSDGDYIMLLEQIRAVKSGRHYFNPIPSML